MLSVELDQRHRRTTDRLYSLDALRGIAALAVVLRHWPQHFGTLYAENACNLEYMPFYSIFSIGYKFGEMAVPFFFCLSGFVFFLLYSASVRDRDVSARDFLILRFSRLFPLHWLTLFAVCLFQFCFAWVSGGSEFVYSNFDVFHFFLNAILMNGVGIEHGYSFNGPTWSVSVEVVCYSVFFIFTYSTDARLWKVICLSICCWLLTPVVGVAGHVLGFLCGGISYLAFDYLTRRVSRVVVLLFWVAVALAWIAAICLPEVERPTSAMHIDGGFVERVLIRVYMLISNRIYQLIVFPATVLVFALTEFKFRLRLSGLSHLGDLSYAVYLIHFPLQILFATIATAFHLSAVIFEYRSMFCLYFSILFVLAFVSYHYFEKPCQKALRGFWVRKI